MIIIYQEHLTEGLAQYWWASINLHISYLEILLAQYDINT